MTTEADLRRAGYPPVRKADETVTISRAQYEALMAARQTLQLVLSLYEDANPKGPLPCGVIRVEPPWVDQARTALRAAGILEEK